MSLNSGTDHSPVRSSRKVDSTGGMIWSTTSISRSGFGVPGAVARGTRITEAPTGTR